MPAFNYCPTCGSALSVDRSSTYAAQKCLCCGTTHYHNSKPTGSVLIVDGARILLSKRAFEPFKGSWDVPGGFLEPGEDPAEGVRREIREETGMEVQVTGPDAVLVGRYGTSGDFTINLYYRAISVMGQPVPADDVSELRWFPLDDLPTDLAYDHERSLLSQLATANKRGQLP